MNDTNVIVKPSPDLVSINITKWQKLLAAIAVVVGLIGIPIFNAYQTSWQTNARIDANHQQVVAMVEALKADNDGRWKAWDEQKVLLIKARDAEITQLREKTSENAQSIKQLQSVVPEIDKKLERISTNVEQLIKDRSPK